MLVSICRRVPSIWAEKCPLCFYIYPFFAKIFFALNFSAKPTYLQAVKYVFAEEVLIFESSAKIIFFQVMEVMLVKDDVKRKHRNRKKTN